MASDIFKLSEIFDSSCPSQILVSAKNGELRRSSLESPKGWTARIDRMAPSGVACGFVRFAPTGKDTIKIAVPGSYRLLACAAGGWLALPAVREWPAYWMPRPPIFRIIDPQGHLLAERPAEITGLAATDCLSTVEIESSPEHCVDWLAWCIPAAETELLESLQHLNNLEGQPVFLWGSHTLYRRPADIYQHLVFGHVYENRFLWPYHRKSCSENDAHTLYVTLSGLQRATGRKIYALLKDQLLLSVLARQSEDGGWHHGEWSEDDMEAHLRLNASAIHLLMDSLDERDDPAVRQALEHAVSFVSAHRDETEVGTWFLHDSLELTEAAMKKTSFRWQASRVIGKSVSNMLVLNTHLDTLVLIDRYRQVSGDDRYQGLVDSAKNAARTVLGLRPLEVVYGLLLRVVHLNLLPVKEQMSLPLPLRALKRIGWQWLRPNLYRLTARFPRFVMPGGYIERAIALRGMADDYHSINVMDLGRYWRRFPEEKMAPIIRSAIEFIQRNHVDSHWAEDKWKNYALGFWAEAVYHYYTLTLDREMLAYLAEIMIMLEAHGIGLPPSLLGGNCEAVAWQDQIACPSPTDMSLRVANLSRKGRIEIMVVNPTETAHKLSWETAAPASLNWQSAAGGAIPSGQSLELPAKGWIVGCAAVNVTDRISCNSENASVSQGVLS